MEQRCPVDDCREMRELRDEIAADKAARTKERENDAKNKKDNYRFWLKIAVIVGVVIITSLLITWSRANVVPDLIIKVEDHEKRLTRTEVRQEAILKNTEEILRKMDQKQDKS